MTSVLCCAYLRVYRPLASFSPAERERFQLSNDEKRSVPGLSRRDGLGLLAPEECLETYVTEIDDETFVCNAQTRLREILGMLSFERSMPRGVTPVFFTETELRDARRELASIEASNPGLRPSVVQSLWHVPLQWFVCFDDSERRIEQHGDHPSIRYRTTVAQAVQRVTEALSTLKGGVVHPVIVGMIFELKEWLASFATGSVLELDYASVSMLFDADELADDRSAADVWDAVRAIGSGNGMDAGLYYRRANERWHRARRRESLN